MTEITHPAVFITLTLLLYIPALWARLLLDLEKLFALKLAGFVLYNICIMIALSDFIHAGHLHFFGVSDSEALKTWASFMVVAHAFTFILPKRFNRWIMRDKHPTTLFVDIVPKQNTKPTRRQRVSDYGRFLQILLFSIFYTLKILTMILYFAPLNPLPLLITAVLFFICVTMSFHENR